MQHLFKLSNEILKILGQNHYKSYTLEELTGIVIPIYINSYKIFYNIAMDRENQSKVLDALILLESEDLISINSITDESHIKIKGLIRIQLNYFLN